MSIASTEEKLKLYFQGDLNKIISKFYKKMNLHFSDDYYSTVTSYDLQKPYAGKTNGWADPTGNRASKLIDLKETAEKYYENYKLLVSIIQELINGLNEEELLILKTHLGLTGENTTSLSKRIKTSHFVIKRKSLNILKEFDNKITGGLIREGNRIFEEY